MGAETPSDPAAEARRGSDLRLNVQMKCNGGGVVVRLAGELDVVTGPWLLERIDGTLGTGERTVSLDLSGLTFLDVAGTRALDQLRNVVTEGSGNLEVSGLQGGPVHLARVLGLDLCG